MVNNEAEAVRGVVLKDFPATVDFIPSDAGTFFDRINAEVEAGKGTASVLGALAGEFATLQASNSLQDLTSLKAEVADAGISDAFWNVASLGTDKTYYVPWIQRKACLSRHYAQYVGTCLGTTPLLARTRLDYH